MTAKEAIEILKEEHDYAQLPSYVNQALGMAITALEENEIYKQVIIRVSLKRLEDAPAVLQIKTAKGFLRGILQLCQDMAVANIKALFILKMANLLLMVQIIILKIFVPEIWKSSEIFTTTLNCWKDNEQ